MLGDRVGPGQQRRAGLGELHASGAANEQRAADRALQRPQVLTHGRLRPAELAGRSADRPAASDRAEDEQPPRVHKHSLELIEVIQGFLGPPSGTIGGMQTIGLIGGMSWYSTMEYYRVINEQVQHRFGGHASASIAMQSLDFAEIRACQVVR